MTVPDGATSASADGTHDGSRVAARKPATQQQRAIQVINAISAGANPGLEAMQLANEFTDRQEARLVAWYRGLRLKH
jgi:hypothetical protein